MKKTLLLSILCLTIVVSFSGCASSNLAQAVHELANDPAKVDVNFAGWGATFGYHREFPTNYVPNTNSFLFAPAVPK